MSASPPRGEPASPLRPLDPAQERWNAGTHGLGIVLAAMALVWLLTRALGSGQTLNTVAAVVFGVSLVAEYTASTLYHRASTDRARVALRRVDHVGIYLLIAGSYTPFALVGLGGSQGWLLFGLIWSTVLLGVGLELAWLHRPRWLNAVLFIALGWIAAFFLGPMAQALPHASLVLLLAGGVVYSLGTVFYIWRSLPYGHAIWHVWVMVGSACHVASIGLFIG